MEIETLCPNCNQWVIIVDDTHNPPEDEHELIYGSFHCPKCNLQGDNLTFIDKRVKQ